MIRRTSILAVLLSLLTLLLYLSPLAVAAEPDATKAFTLLNQDTNVSESYDTLKAVAQAMATAANYTLTVNKTYNVQASDFDENKTTIPIKVAANTTLTLQSSAGEPKKLIQGIAGKRSLDIFGEGKDTSKVVINNLEFEGKNVGGGIDLADVTAKLTNVNFSNHNQTLKYGGGALYASMSAVELLGCHFTGNKKAGGNGGAIYVTDSTLKASEGTEFKANEAGFGGAVMLYGKSTAELDGCQFVSNRASMYGGAVCLLNVKGEHTFKNCTFKDNHANDRGGAVANLANGVEAERLFTSKLTLVNGTFENNTSDTVGGAVFNQLAETVIQADEKLEGKPVFSQNKAKVYGGAIGSVEGILTVKNADFSGNSTELDEQTLDGNKTPPAGGAIYAQPILVSERKLTVDSCTFTTNTSANGGAIYSMMPLNDISNSTFKLNNARNEKLQKNEYGIGGAVNITGKDETSKAKATISACKFIHNLAYAGGGLYVGFDKTASAEIKDGTKFVENGATLGGGGAIYIHPGQYTATVGKAYQNVNIDKSTQFAKNKVPTWYIPPEDAADLTNLQFASTSIDDIPFTEDQIPRHILNNRDINYSGRLPFIYDSNQMKIEGQPNTLVLDKPMYNDTNYQVLAASAPALNFVQEGWSLKEWNTKADGTGTAYQPGTVIKPIPADAHLYAIWQVKVQFKVENGTPTNIQDVLAQVGQPVSKPTVDLKATKEGDVFQGWYLGDKLWDFSQPVMGPMTLVAKFGPKPVEPQDGNDNDDNNANTNNGPGYWGYNPNLNHQPAQGNTQVVVPNQQGDQGQPQQAEKPAKSSLPATGAVDTTIPVLALMAIAVLMLRKGRA